MRTKQWKTKALAAALAAALLLAVGFGACADGDAAAPAAAGGSGGSAAAATGGGATGNFAQPARDLSAGPFKIAFVPLGASGPTMPTAMKAYYDALGGEDNGIYKIDVFDSQFDTTKQLQIMQDLITQKYDAIILEANDPNALNSAVHDAEAAGIPVITRNMDMTGARVLHTLNSDYSSGWAAGKFIQENAGKPDDANCIILDVVADLKTTVRMGTGFEDYLNENTNWNLLDVQPITDTSQENGNTVMSTLLAKYDKIDIVYTVSDDVAVGALQAIESAGRQDEGIIIWGYEGHPLALQAIKDGKIYGTSFADVYQQAYSTMVMIKFLMETGITAANLGMEYSPTAEFVTIPTTKDNIDEVLAAAGVTLE